MKAHQRLIREKIAVTEGEGNLFGEYWKKLNLTPENAIIKIIVPRSWRTFWQKRFRFIYIRTVFYIYHLSEKTQARYQISVFFTQV